MRTMRTMRTMRFIALCALISCCHLAHADFEITDFSALPIDLSYPITTGGQPNTAAIDGTVLQVTPGVLSNRGIVWTTEPQVLTGGFTTTFEFEFVLGTGAGGSGDGLAFVIQNESIDAYGDHASAMGYGGFASSPDNGITNSLAVELDDFSNPNWGDPNGNHIGVHTLFAASNSQDESASLGTNSLIPSFAQGTGVHTVMVDYDPGGELQVFLDDLTTPVLTVTVDLAMVLGGDSGWIGFTGSGGGAYQVENVLTWSFTNGGSSGAPDFPRGDANGDGAVGALVDGLYILNFGFSGGPTPPCFAAADVNGDLSVGALLDGLYLLNFGFSIGPPPPSPGTTCGPDPASVTALGCDSPPCP